MDLEQLKHQKTEDLLILLRATIENSNSGLDREKELIVCDIIRIMSERTTVGMG